MSHELKIEFNSVSVPTYLIQGLRVQDLGMLLKIAVMSSDTGYPPNPIYQEPFKDEGEHFRRIREWYKTQKADWQLLRKDVRHSALRHEPGRGFDLDAAVYRLWQQGFIKLLLDQEIINDSQFVAYAEWMRAYTEVRTAERPPRHGYVYIVRSENGDYKIGRTINPNSRGKTFDVKLPLRVKFELLIESPDYRGLERELHQRFASKRIDGEWFKLTPEDVEQLRIEFTKK